MGSNWSIKCFYAGGLGIVFKEGDWPRKGIIRTDTHKHMYPV